MRKMIHHEFKAEGVKRWQGVQTQACYGLLHALLHSPEDFTQADSKSCPRIGGEFSLRLYDFARFQHGRPSHNASDVWIRHRTGG